MSSTRCTCCWLDLDAPALLDPDCQATHAQATAELDADTAVR